MVMHGVEARMDRVPSLGEHSHEILRDLGYGDDDIHRLQDEAAI